MGIIVPENILGIGVGDHKQHAACFFLAADDPPDAGEWGGDILHDIFHPLVMFLLQLLIGEVENLTAHIREAPAVAFQHIVGKRHGGTRTELLQFQAPEGITQSF